MMQAFYFGPEQRPLFAQHHPAVGAMRRAPVLLCTPHGQEAIRCHRLGRVLADRLARNGHNVLRFDPFGSGDSGGDDTDLDLDGWRDDMLAAHSELQRRARKDNAIWVGIRLGGSTAVRALQAIRAGTLVEPRLVLLDPIIDGAAHLKHLRERHADTVVRAYAYGRLEWQRRMEAERDKAPTELIGFGISQRLREQLARLDPMSLALPPGASVRLLASPSDRASSAWAESQRQGGCTVLMTSLTHNFDYTSEEAQDTALVPHDLVGALAEQVSAS